MKLLIIITQKEDASRLLKRFRKDHISVTELTSTSGFLRRVNTTLLLAVADEDVARITNVIQEVCRPRLESVDTTFAAGDLQSIGLPAATEVPIGGAILLVVPLEGFIKM